MKGATLTAIFLYRSCVPRLGSKTQPVLALWLRASECAAYAAMHGPLPLNLSLQKLLAINKLIGIFGMLSTIVTREPHMDHAQPHHRRQIIMT